MGGGRGGKGKGKPSRAGEDDGDGLAIPVHTKTSEELPIFAHRDAILTHIREHRITHIQGETGCGKSTQVPKYIMEEAEMLRKTGRGDGVTKIVVTQPRRMAAITLARRVADELGEEIGKTVGYKISGDCVAGKLCFVTTGFLLQVLVNQPEEFSTYTHVILDEVHERSVDADLLTMLMKLLMQCSPKVRLIVMSATLQAHLFAQYFANVEAASALPSQMRRSRGRGAPALPEVKPIFVGVRTYPVQEIFLDELDDNFQISGGFARQGLDKALNEFWKMEGKGGGGGGKGKGKGKGKDSASGFRRMEPQIAQGFDELCKELVIQLAREKCTLIVFLPGIADITSFYECMASLDTSRQDRRSSLENDDDWRADRPARGATNGGGSGDVSLRIYPMHSLIPREEQEEVFNAPPPGICHVVLASNIAESSLTLPSVCGIIDLSMRRSIQYDARRLMSCLVTTWCSQSSCKQRAGRAGRTMPGRAVRLVTRSFFESEMVEFDPPEMLNAPLTKLYLQAKQLCSKLENMWDNGLIPEGIDMDLSTPTKLLGEVVQPPSTNLTQAAIRELADVGCLDRATEDALITPLGYIAMALPCELRLCRLLYLGLMFKCPCDAIAMVAGLTAADPFSTPSLLVIKDQREYIKKLERSFEARLWCDRGRHSEPIMLRDLFRHWIEAGAPRGPRQMGAFAREWNIIPKKFEALASEAVDLCTRVVKLLPPRSHGFVSLQRLLQAMRFSVDRREELVKSQFPTDSEYKKLFSEDVGLMRALVAASFSDQLLLHLKPRWAPSGGGKKKKDEQIVEIMKKQGLDFRGTVCVLNPPNELRTWNAEENHQRLCEAMCGSRAKRVHWDEKEKLLFYDFKSAAPEGSKKKKKGAHFDADEDWDDELNTDAVIRDVVPEAHRLHQFGAGRWKFSVHVQSVEDDDNEDAAWHKGPLEMLKPVQPFLINWEVVQHTSQESTKGGGKGGKGKKSSSVKAMPDWRNPIGFACNASGMLPPEEHIGVCASVQGLESGASAFVAGATVLGLNWMPILLTTLDPEKWQVQLGFDEDGEVVALKIMHFEIFLPPETLTADVLWKVNKVREALLTAVTPWEEPEDGRRGGNNRDRGFRDGRGGQGYIWIGDASAEMAELLQEVWPWPEAVRRNKKIYWQPASGEAISDVHDWIQPLVEEVDWDVANDGYTQGQASSKKSKKQSSGEPAVAQQIVAYLKKRPKGEERMSSICGRFQVKPGVLQKIQGLDVPARGDGYVRLSKGGGGGGGGEEKKHGKGGKSGKGSEKTGALAAGVDRRVEELCRTPGIGCQLADFDARVRRQMQGLEKHHGKAAGLASFEMLSEWCSKKDRDSVRSWTAYLMVLLRNWENKNFGDASP